MCGVDQDFTEAPLYLAVANGRGKLLLILPKLENAFCG